MATAAERLTAALAGRYRIERELGSGGMATVFLAEDLKHHREVAIKLLREDVAASLGARRFIQEIDIAARLQHPNILPLLDSGEIDGLLYYVMPFVEGESLRKRLAREGELPVSEAVRVLLEVVDALAYAHAHGVVHRDIKPDNVMLSGRHALVADFGVARAVTEATGGQTTSGVVLGTPVYMAPEQAAADPNVDARADLYAVGVVAFEILTGRPPFTGVSRQQVLAAHMTASPEPVRRLRPGIAPSLEHAVMRCLEKRPADRWQTAEALLAQLEQAPAPRDGTARPGTWLERLMPRSRPSRLAASAIVAIVVVAGLVRLRGAAISFGHGAPKAEAPPITLDKTRQLTAEDGLEIQPTISPDGLLIAYAAGTASRMRIFIRPLAGGRTIPLSDDTSRVELLPEWSPDGGRILFETLRGVFVAPSLGGSSSQIAAITPSATIPFVGASPIGSASWSPDGREVAIVENDSLVVQPAEGRAGAARFVAIGYALHSCAWSPNGRWIACISGNVGYTVPGGAFGNIAPTAIMLCPAGGGILRALTQQDAMYQSPVWSPDAKWLYFVSNRDGARDVYALRVSDEGQAIGVPTRLTTGLAAHSIAYSSNGRYLAYSVYSAHSNIWRLPIPSKGSVTLAGAEAMTSGNQVIEAMRPSPDRKWLVYDSDLEGNADIYRMPLAGGRPERLTTHRADDFAPALSPDGREIAFHSFRAGSRDIFVQPLDGGPVQQLTSSPGQESFPDWSPDGHALAWYDQLPPVTVYIARRDRAGQWEKPVPRLTGVTRPHWSPDGRWIAAPRADLSGAIELIPADSGAHTTVYHPVEGTSDPHAEDVHWSNDGMTLYFKSHDAQGRASIWSVAVAGGRPHLLVRFDDPSRTSNRADFATDGTYFYFSLEDRQSDIWVADVRPR
jgi:serine/threonine-protein kinase